MSMNLDKYARNNCLFYKEIGDNRKVFALILLFFSGLLFCAYIYLFYIFYFYSMLLILKLKVYFTNDGEDSWSFR